jgi:aconitate hydratase
MAPLGRWLPSSATAALAAGNQGLKPAVTQAVEQQGRAVAAVLSGNRISTAASTGWSARAIVLTCLVVAFALAGRVTIDEADPMVTDASGAPVYLRDSGPMIGGRCCRAAGGAPDVFASGAASPRFGRGAIAAPRGVLFPWDAASSYIVEPPFFAQRVPGFATADRVAGARILGIYADGMTTDHVSPGGEIPADSPAGQYLQSLGIAPGAFNSYIGRRGNHHVMMRGTYSNLRTRNRMADREGWWTKIYPDGEVVTVFDAATRYADRNVPLVVLGGQDFGTGSSRDWAAKGPALLGVRAVIANSFERIHRSNLIGVGIVPLLFRARDSVDMLALDGSEELAFTGIEAGIATGSEVAVSARRSNGDTLRFEVRADVRSPAEAALLRRGGMFQAALERIESVTAT